MNVAAQISAAFAATTHEDEWERLLARRRLALAAALTVRTGVQMNETETAIMDEYDAANAALAAFRQDETSDD